MRSWRQRYEEASADGLVDRRVGEPSPRRAPEDELERMRVPYQQDYQGFTIKHFHGRPVEPRRHSPPLQIHGEIPASPTTER